MKNVLIISIIAVFLTILATAGGATAATYPPGLMFSTVLNGVKLDHKTGEFFIDRIQAVFLPDATSKMVYPYNPDDGGKIWALLKNSSGQEMARYDFYGEKLESPYWLLNSYNLSSAAMPDRINVHRFRLDPGSYVLDFYLEGAHFYHFPFSVDKSSSGDPFAGGDFYFLNGDWQDWGYMFYSGANPEQSLVFKIWLRNKGNEKEKDVKVKIEVRDPAGKLICTSRPEMTHTLTPEWIRFEFDLIFPMQGTSGGAYFKAKDLLGKDGTYVLKISIDNKPYGEWPLSISGGKFDYTGRTVRGQASSLTFVEGGRDAFWYKKK